MSTPKIAIADDHKLVRNGIKNILESNGIEVDYDCENGKQLLNYALANKPDLVLMDLKMPELDGWEATARLKEQNPETRVIALSMNDDDQSIIRVLRAGAKGYLLKDANPAELVRAIELVMEHGFYHNELVSARLIKVIAEPEKPLNSINEREREFLQHACSEFTYKEIAEEMHVSPRTVDGYRDSLFQKLGLKSRVGLVLFAIKNGVVNLP